MKETSMQNPILDQIFETMLNELEKQESFPRNISEKLKTFLISGNFNDPESVAEILKLPAEQLRGSNNETPGA